MAATASTRDLIKAIGTYFASPTLPLPGELSRVLEAYLHKHEKHEGNGAEDRLQDELQAVYHKHVAGHPSRIAPFLAVLRHLHPGIRSPGKILHWFELLSEPILDNIHLEKGLDTEALANIEDIISIRPDYREWQDPLTSRALERWLQLSGQTGDATAAFKEKIIRETIFKLGKRQPKTIMNALAAAMRQSERRCLALSLLCDFVQSQPPHLHLVVRTSLFKCILTCLERDTSTTAVALALTALTMLLPNLPGSLAPFLPSLFNIYARLLFWDREISSERAGSPYRLQSEEDGPWELLLYSPDSEGTAIPQLLHYFTILYGLYPINFMDYIRKPQRYLRHANFPNADDIEVQPSEIQHRSERFRERHLLHPNFYSLTIESERTDFGRWIKSEPAVVVAECMALCTLDAGAAEEGEDPLDYPGGASGLSGDDAEGSRPGKALPGSSVVLIPFPDPASASWRNTLSTAVDSPGGSRAHSAVMRRGSQNSHRSANESLEIRTRDVGGDSPTLPPLLVQSPSQARLQDMIYSNKVMKSGLSQSLANDSVPSLSLSHPESPAERGSAAAVPPPTQSQFAPRSPATPGPSIDGSMGEVARLQRQIMVLKNDLNFERYMKRQHVAHIGELRHRQVKEAATEAETQSLIMGHRNLKKQLEAAKRSELQGKRDAERSRALAKKWEADLSAKLKLLRDEQKKRSAEVDALRRELDSARDECERLRRLLCEAEVKEINSTQTMQTIDISHAETARLRAEVERLAAVERDYQAGQMAMEQKLADAVEAEHRAELLAMKLQSVEAELADTTSHYQSRIVVLNTHLAEALKSQGAGGGRGAAGMVGGGGDCGEGSSSTSALLESAMAASRAKQAELQKQYSLLMRKYTALQSSVQDNKKSNATSGGVGGGARRRNEVSGSADADAEISAIVAASSPAPPPSSSFSARATRMQRGFSDPAALEGGSPLSPSPGSYQPRHPPQPLQESYGSATSTGTAVRRPSTPSGGAVGGDGGPGLSPQGERYYGRGGMQNTIRKERKEKKRDGPDKKDRKSGIRGIRSFV